MVAQKQCISRKTKYKKNLHFANCTLRISAEFIVVSLTDCIVSLITVRFQNTVFGRGDDSGGLFVPKRDQRAFYYNSNIVFLQI